MSAMIPPVHEVDISPMSPGQLVPLLRPDRGEVLLAMAAKAREELAGRTIWNVSSTAAGGGVAEMLHRLVRYASGAGVSSRWVVIDGNADFFTITKRVHNRLHGESGDDGALGNAERDVMREVTEANAEPFMRLVGQQDVVIVHDPQPVGLVPALRDRGIPVIWRCHVGTETTDQWTDEAWSFLRPWVETADAVVFSRPAYVPRWAPSAPIPAATCCLSVPTSRGSPTTRRASRSSTSAQRCGRCFPRRPKRLPRSCRCRSSTSSRTPPSSTHSSATPWSFRRRACGRASGSLWPRGCGKRRRSSEAPSAASRTRCATGSTAC